MDAGGEAIVRAELQPDEILQWWGQPSRRHLFVIADAFLIPFSIFWAGFAFFWEGTVVVGISRTNSAVPWFFVLWGLPFIGLGLYFLVGRFYAKQYTKARTYYAVTDRRVMTISVAFRNSVQSASIKRLPGLQLSTGRDGFGSVTFGQWSPFAGMYANTGMDFFGWGRGQRPLAFYDLDDARSVYNLVERLSSK